MAYADQQMSGNKIIALIIVALIHIALVYALVTGLAYEGARNVIKKLTTVDIEEEKKPEEPPPPPPKDMPAPPPPVAPPVRIDVITTAPQIETVQVAPPPAPVVPVIAPPAPVIAPPAPRVPPKAAAPRGRPGDWVTTNDYPSRALREEREGTTGFRLSVGPDGRVTNCEITSSSGSPDLDQATCDNLRRRARFTPATDGEGQPTSGSYVSRTRWVIPKD